MIRLAVIMPAYNGSRTIRDSIASMLSQTYTEFDFIICDDGSTDGTKDVVRGFEDPRIHLLVNQVNRGLGPTMNRLVYSLSESIEYFAVAEQDDWYPADRLERQVAYLDANPEVGLVSGVAEFITERGVSRRFPGLLANGGQYPDDPTEMFKLNYREQIKVVNTCMMVRRTTHTSNGLYFSQHYPSIPVDWAYVLRFCQVGKVRGLSEVMVKMDRRGDRGSVTSHRQRHYAAARELLRSFRYERSDIVTNADFRYAQQTQEIIELGNTSKYASILRVIRAFLRGRIDGRMLAYCSNRIRKYFFPRSVEVNM